MLFIYPNLTEAFRVAVALSIFLMMTTDSLHPPSGAVAITAVLSGHAVRQAGLSLYFLSCAAQFSFAAGDCNRI